MLDKIIECISSAEKSGLVEGSENSVLTGFSGKKLIGTLQRLSRLYSDAVYLEVGVFQGLTLLSVANSNSSLPCYGIDNFAHFDPGSKNLGIVKDRASQLGISNYNIINKDYEDALADLKNVLDKPVGVYFVDGPHDYRSQLICLEMIKPYLHEQAVIIVDDSNYNHVRQANRDFLVCNPEFKLLFEAYTDCHPQNMTKAQEDEARNGWWDGVNIIVRDPQDALEVALPDTRRDRILYENEHVVHSHRLAELSPYALEVASLLFSNQFYKFPRALLGLYKKYLANKKEYASRWKFVNTYSDKLPKSKMISKKA